MKGIRILLFALVGAWSLPSAWAQTNGGPAPTVSGPADAPSAPDPVVLPPSAVAPPEGDPSVQAHAVAPAAQATPPPLPGASVAKGDEIYDIRPPLFLLRSWLWLWIFLAMIVGVALLILLWRWFAPRFMPTPKSAYDLALEKLEHARGLMNEDNPVPYAVAVSETIRTYLNQRFRLASDPRTTEEFLRQMQNDAASPLAEHRDLLAAFLQACDLLKFARYQPRREELEQVQHRAQTFVMATKPAPVSEENKNRPVLVPSTP